jgi:hypothetical protein
MRGECLCGEIQFEIDTENPKLYQCHCSQCRKQGGSSSNTATIIASEHFKWLAGAELVSSFMHPTGFRSDFCSKCGSPVPNPLRSTPYFWIPAGLFEMDTNLEIVAHLFVDSKAAWETIASTGNQYKTMPEFAELVQKLHSGEIK